MAKNTNNRNEQTPPMDAFERLIRQFAKLPGIGRRSAERMAYYILETDEVSAMALANAVQSVKKDLRTCRDCGDLTEGERCALCLDPQRETGTWCVVEWPKDLRSLEKSRVHQGRYHVLMGRLSPINGVEPQDLRVNDLLRRIKEAKPKEVILALSPSAEGDTTALWLADKIRDVLPSVKISRPARGLPSGSDLSFAQSGTLSDAIQDRKPI